MTDIPSSPDLSRPNAARMYDYYLGGAANMATDREAAERILAVLPNVRQWARSNRSFLGRAVRYLCEQGIDQFLDLGSGIPTVGNVHERAHRSNPDAKVAYVDFEPVAVEHARALLDGDSRVSVTLADLREPEQVLAAEGVRGLLDFSRPIGVLAVAALHFVPDSEDPVGIMTKYRDACVRGSYLAITHLSHVAHSDEDVDHTLSIYKTTATPGTMRSPEEIGALLPGYRLVDPGIVLLDEWRPDRPVTHEQAMQTNSYAVIGRLD